MDSTLPRKSSASKRRQRRKRTQARQMWTIRAKCAQKADISRDDDNDSQSVKMEDNAPIPNETFEEVLSQGSAPDGNGSKPVGKYEFKPEVRTLYVHNMMVRMGVWSLDTFSIYFEKYLLVKRITIKFLKHARLIAPSSMAYFA